MTDPSPTPRTGSPWVKAGIVGALGGEFVGAIIAGTYLGHWVDERFETQPVGLLVGMMLGLVGVSVHIVRIAKRFLLQEERAGEDDDRI